MDYSKGTPRSCLHLKSLSNKVGTMLWGSNPTNAHKRLDAKLTKKFLEVRQNFPRCDNFKSINSIIMKFPLFKQGLRNIRRVFNKYDEDSNGLIDLEELKKCVNQLQLHLTEEEVEDLFHSYDMDGSEGIQFNEFIVLLCLIHLLKRTSSTTSEPDSLELEETFDALIQVFIFLDKNGDGKLHKRDMVEALNEPSPYEKSPSHLANIRFRELDWDRRGRVSFRQFLFGFLNWVGINYEDEGSDEVKRAGG